MLLITILVLLCTLVVVGMAVVSFCSSQIKVFHMKSTPYECGFDPLGSARLPFSMRFFLVAILFLLFDLEIALLLPLPWGVQLASPENAFLWAVALLLLLTLGLIYEWIHGGLDWAE
uniref:NADH-ubiquinone oxidoreductase chain 3 n=1 Tax=Apistus carinatus TaxID=990932 RepID=A0A679DPZ8_9TELE|nr:NADH dehydrogenase subunit 3 [Apistus carinatus]